MLQFIDIHKGFRKYFANGLFVEQSIGVGVIGKSFKTDSYWYYDKYMASVATWGQHRMGLHAFGNSRPGLQFRKGPGRGRHSLDQAQNILGSRIQGLAPALRGSASWFHSHF